MDTWQGNNFDPASLHKYTYVHNSPINNIDPSGHMSMASVGSGLSIMGNLASIALTTYDVFKIATGEEELSAADLGMAIILARVPTRLASRLITKACRKNNSFEAGTLVATEFGLTPIEEIKVGDRVWAFNEHTGKKSLQEVVHLIVSEGHKELIDIELSSGDIVTATFGHPFYLSNTNEWIVAGNITEGDLLIDFQDLPLAVTGTENYRESIKVYNLTVANDHTYYVGKIGVLSHNMGGCRLKEQRIPSHSYEAARKKALDLLGPIDASSRKKIIGRLPGSKGNGKVVGFETKVDGVWKQYRIDYDPVKGPHINVKVGKGKDMIINHSVEFPGNEKDFEKLLKLFN